MVIPGTVRDVDDNPHEVVPVENATVTPVPFYFLGLVTGSTKVIHDFKHSLSGQFCWDIPSIIESKG
jgi:hypothetical protein